MPKTCLCILQNVHCYFTKYKQKKLPLLLSPLCVTLSFCSMLTSMLNFTTFILCNLSYEKKEKLHSHIYDKIILFHNSLTSSFVFLVQHKGVSTDLLLSPNISLGVTKSSSPSLASAFSTILQLNSVLISEPPNILNPCSAAPNSPPLFVLPRVLG